jgi:hypothetical protein
LLSFLLCGHKLRGFLCCACFTTILSLPTKPKVMGPCDHKLRCQNTAKVNLSSFLLYFSCYFHSNRKFLGLSF